MRRGFTLVELAIVLVIIGIILGAILKGQEMIFNAKVKRLQNQFKEIMAAIYSYYDRYGYYPGDDPAAGTRWTGYNSGDGNGFIDGYICDDITTDESCWLWQHLRLANLISGDPAITDPNALVPKHAFGGPIQVFSGIVNGVSGHWLMFQNVPAEAAEIFDKAFDDGKCNTGTVFGLGGGCDTTTGDYQYNDIVNLHVRF